MPAIACPASLAIHACTHWHVLFYLAPSLAFALLFRFLAKVHPAFLLLFLSGTALHELAHFCAGLVTNARPTDFSLLPRRAAGNRWILGSVSFANIRWYNAVFVGLAPIVTLLVPLAVAIARQKLAASYGWFDLLIAALLAPVYLGFLPSRTDWLIALRSWPYVLALGAGLWTALHGLPRLA